MTAMWVTMTAVRVTVIVGVTVTVPAAVGMSVWVLPAVWVAMMTSAVIENKNTDQIDEETENRHQE